MNCGPSSRAAITALSNRSCRRSSRSMCPARSLSMFSVIQNPARYFGTFSGTYSSNLLMYGVSGMGTVVGWLNDVAPGADAAHDVVVVLPDVAEQETGDLREQRMSVLVQIGTQEVLACPTVLPEADGGGAVVHVPVVAAQPATEMDEEVLHGSCVSRLVQWLLVLAGTVSGTRRTRRGDQLATRSRRRGRFGRSSFSAPRQRVLLAAG